jgi:hypothetical protein
MGNRVFYACQAVFIDGTYLQNVQSVGVDYSADAESIYDAGRSQVFGDRYNKPEVTITIERHLRSGDTPFYTTGTGSYEDSYLLKNSNLGIAGWSGLKEYEVGLTYSDDRTVSGSIDSVKFEYCLVTEISYNFSVDGVFTESITFVCNNLTKQSAGSVPAAGDSGGLMKRRNFDTQNSIFPTEVDASILTTEASGKKVRVLQSVAINLSVSYSELADTGFWRGSNQGNNPSEQNKYKYIETPVEVTCEINCVARKSIAQDILIKDTNFMGTFPTPDRQIVLKFDNIIFDLGSKNYLTGVGFSGGDTGGGNVEASFSYTNDSNDYMPYTNATIVTKSQSTIY